jgi:hypothetical protein
MVNAMVSEPGKVGLAPMFRKFRADLKKTLSEIAGILISRKLGTQG